MEKFRNRPELIMKGWFSCINRIVDPFDEKVHAETLKDSVKHSSKVYNFVLSLIPVIGIVLMQKMNWMGC
jgi:hypothetical protein